MNKNKFPIAAVGKPKSSSSTESDNGIFVYAFGMVELTYVLVQAVRWITLLDCPEGHCMVIIE